MKKTSSVILFVSIILMLFVLSSCGSDNDSKQEASNEIPEQCITYTNFTFGNVIQDGKQAIFLNFASDYTVTKIEIAGALLDKDENSIHSFETSLTFATPSYNPELSVRIEVGLVKYIESVSFTKIKAYTAQSIGANNDEKMSPIAALNGSTIENYYATGSTITVTNERINIQLDNKQIGCGFRWNLSAVNLKQNTKYVVKFEDIDVADIDNKSIQLGINWGDSTYTFLRYYNVKGKCFDIISSGAISNDYYQFLKSKAYDEYVIEFSFKHNVDKAKSKNLYFDFRGVKGQMSIGKISLYEKINGQIGSI